MFTGRIALQAVLSAPRSASVRLFSSSLAARGGLSASRLPASWAAMCAGRGFGSAPLRLRGAPLRRRALCTSSQKRANLNEGAAETAVSTKVQMREAVETGKNYTLLFVIGGMTLGFGFVIIQYLLPSGTSPNALFNEACAAVDGDETLAELVGKPYHFFGADRHSSGRAGRRNRVDSFSYTDPSENNLKYTRVKFNVQGRHTNAIVYAEKSAAMGSGQFNYLILECPKRKKVWTIVNEQKKVSLAQMQGDVVELLQQYPNSKEEVVLFGSSRCKWTKRQLMELGVRLRLRFRLRLRPLRESGGGAMRAARAEPAAHASRRSERAPRAPGPLARSPPRAHLLANPFLLSSLALFFLCPGGGH